MELWRKKACSLKKEGVFLLAPAVWKAKEEWEAALSFFQEATAPELIEGAAFEIRARERYYIYLLKRAKEERVLGEIFLK